MDKFERLNRETQDYNNHNVNRLNESNPSRGSLEYWLNQYNNQTYKANNGAYSSKYY